MKINILEQAVYNRIAAGEVVENPASAVKELVENSIDAGATQITVSIEQGGIKSIEIVDNGCGIEKGELHKTIFPHATSKIADAEDLASIATLGFRGEALACISAVSDIEIKTKSIDEVTGSRLTAKGGDNVNIVDIAYNRGTSITISNLFYNTPARFKFLKGVKTEEAYVTKAMSQMILSNPNISIKYVADGKQIYFSDGDGAESAIKAIYPVEICKNLIPLESGPELAVQICGYISNPSLYKNNRNFQTIILNGRVVSDPNISATVNSAFGERLMQRCHPVFIINIIMRFDEVDVNVHPNKREIRFSNPRQVYGAIYNAVRYSLEAYEHHKRSETIESEVLAATQPIVKAPIADQTDAKQTVIRAVPNKPIFDVAYYLDKIESPSEKSAVLEVSDFVGFPTFQPVFEPTETIGEPIKEEKSVQGKQTASTAQTAESADGFKIIGQIFDTYIAVETKNALLLIDQHAAHERLLYDKLQNTIKNGETASQSLMIPYIYEDSPLRIAEISALSSEINALGFEIEPFGNNTLKINAVPAVLTDTDPCGFIEEVVNGLSTREFAQGDMIKEKLMQKACKSAIKGGYVYSKEQSEMIVNYFFAAGMPLQCPHGRPTYINFTKSELEKLFRRKL